MTEAGHDSARHERDRVAWRLGAWIARLVGACERHAIAVVSAAALLAAADASVRDRVRAGLGLGGYASAA